MKKYRYNINNLDCANCAREIEENLNKIDYLSDVIVNFNTSKLVFYSDKDITLDEINKLVKKIEPDVTITDNEVEVKKEFHFSILIIGVIIGLLGIYLNIPKMFKYILIVISYSLLLYRTFINAIKLLFKSFTINENALITISSIGACLVGEQMEGIMVIALYTIGKILEEKAINNSRRSIKSLIDIKQNYANKKIGKKVEKVDVEDIKLNDILVVKKGEKIPVDAIVVKGTTKLDTASLTGESELVEVNINDKVISGTINMDSVIEIKATSIFENSTVSKILELVSEATDKKAKTETFISKVSKIYTPVVLILAVIIAIFMPMLFNINYSESIYRGLTFLVISCPCAIAISVPLSYFSGIGTSSKNGILVKGSNYLDNLSHINKIIFDKTGTLTNGTFNVVGIDVIDDNYTKDEVIDILLKGESLSNHPIAKSILKLKDKDIDNSDVKDFKEIEGKGISYTLDNKKIKIGNKKVCDCGYDAILHLSIDNKHVASINIDDGIKNDAFTCINTLKSQNIKTYMFTGDKKEVALDISNKLNIDEVKYEMLPTDKYEMYGSIIGNNDIIAFVGDGVNDAPVLKRADIGISMGSIGSESAIEASDIVIISDDLNKIPLAIDISKYTKRIIKQNLIFAMLVKISILVLSVFGLANMWFAVFADTGVTLLTILNTLRILRKFKKD